MKKSSDNVLVSFDIRKKSSDFREESCFGGCDELRINALLVYGVWEVETIGNT